MYTLKNKDGITKQVKKGFSWTTLFMGIFVPIYRGDWKWALISGLLAIITKGFSWFIFPFIYNELYLQELLKQGYEIQ